MPPSSLDRARLLIAQERWPLAEQELRRCLGDDPDDSVTHQLLALCLLHREEFELATSEAQTGVRLAPDSAFAHHVLSKILLQRNMLAPAERAARESLRLDPDDADYAGWLGVICCGQKRWQEALDLADQGLSCDAQCETCLNVRAMALAGLGRKQDAGDSLALALQRNPDNAFTHANQGWTLLHQGQPQPALEHFREALRLEPDLDFARRGIVEAMKARNPLYRAILGLLLAMASLSTRAQWGLMVGGWLGYRALNQVAERSPQLRPWVTPVLYGYIAFVMVTWLAIPLSNLLLRLNRFGRLTLTRLETRTSEWVGGALLVARVCFAIAQIGLVPQLTVTAVMCGLLAIPLSAIYSCEQGWPRTTLQVCTGFMAGLAAVVTCLLIIGDPVQRVNGRYESDWWFRQGLFGAQLFGVLILLLQFAIARLVAVKPRR